MNYRQKLSNAYIDRNRKLLLELFDLLIEDKTKMDKWFELFIDKFSERMDVEKQTSPVWKKYNEKFDEYSDLQRQISTAKYYLENV